jgi:hypothetical protein
LGPVSQTSIRYGSTGTADARVLRADGTSQQCVCRRGVQRGGLADGRRSRMLAVELLENVRLFTVLSFYLFCNLYPFFLPIAAYHAIFSSYILPRALALLTCIDYVYPLRPGPKGLWVWWCQLTKINGGLRSYFGAECVIEGEFKRDKNYLIVYHPHGLFGIAHGLYSEALFDQYGIESLFTGADVIFLMPLLRRLMT